LYKHNPARFAAADWLRSTIATWRELLLHVDLILVAADPQLRGWDH
jgi:hypothetical protein